jgi:hypothetical protein
MKTLILIIVALGLKTAGAQIMETVNFDTPFFHSTDVLAPRDDLGLIHQGRIEVNDTDYAHRHPFRWFYWFEGKHQLVTEVAYVAALQRDLKRLGYYCGPIDGVYSDDVSDAIARLQKNYSMRVTGTPTIAVRRALHLP